MKERNVSQLKIIYLIIYYNKFKRKTSKQSNNLVLSTDILILLIKLHSSSSLEQPGPAWNVNIFYSHLFEF